jgi:hypothetical protein
MILRRKRSAAATRLPKNPDIGSGLQYNGAL